VLIALDEVGAAVGEDDDLRIDPIAVVEGVGDMERGLVDGVASPQVGDQPAAAVGTVDPITDRPPVRRGRHLDPPPEMTPDDLLLPGVAAVEDGARHRAGLVWDGRNALSDPLSSWGCRIAEEALA